MVGDVVGLVLGVVVGEADGVLEGGTVGYGKRGANGIDACQSYPEFQSHINYTVI